MRSKDIAELAGLTLRALRHWTVRNIDARYEAFDVKPGDKLYLPPEERVKVW